MRAIILCLLLAGCASQVTISPRVGPDPIVRSSSDVVEEAECRRSMAGGGFTDEFIIRRGELEITDRRIASDYWSDECDRPAPPLVLTAARKPAAKLAVAKKPVARLAVPLPRPRPERDGP